MNPLILPGKTLRIVNWNICYSSRAVGAYAEFDWEHRREGVLAEIAAQQADVFCFEEVQTPWIADLRRVLCDSDWGLFSKPYGSRAQDNLVMFIAKSAVSQDTVQVDAPGRSLLVKYNKNIAICACHFSMKKDERIQHATQLCDLFGHAGYNNTIMTGDFNSFPDEGGYDQMRILTGFGRLHDATQFLLDAQTNKLVHRTFWPYPYDMVPDGVEPIKLDYVLAGNCMCVSAVAYNRQVFHTGTYSFGASDHSLINVVVNCL